ncbi:MAG: hypothetical protein KatS3mg061_1147 [Dehalococcoidia bacterium]|nr:MAG: hypothetical protein KatS3mg061_1147 [Dehalococcoidia bacterium]
MRSPFNHSFTSSRSTSAATGRVTRHPSTGRPATARDIDGVVAAFGIEQLIIIGLSMGGRAGMYYAATRPERGSRGLW